MRDALDSVDKEQVMDYAWRLLKERGKPISYDTLIDEVVGRFFSEVEDPLRAKARFYTWLNLDTRFNYNGQGLWGLRSWAPAKGNRRLPVLTLMHKTVEYDDSNSRIKDGGEREDDLFSTQEIVHDDVVDDSDEEFEELEE